MTLRDPNSPVRRMAIAIAAAVAIMLAAGLIYVFLTASKESSARFNGAAIVSAARAYTHDLKARQEPVPESVTLEQLAALHFLKPEDIEAFRGLKATVELTSTNAGPRSAIMRVHFPDGSDIVLLGDGTVQQTAH